LGIIEQRQIDGAGDMPLLELGPMAIGEPNFCTPKYPATPIRNIKIVVRSMSFPNRIEFSFPKATSPLGGCQRKIRKNRKFKQIKTAF